MPASDVLLQHHFQHHLSRSLEAAAQFSACLRRGIGYYVPRLSDVHRELEDPNAWLLVDAQKPHASLNITILACNPDQHVHSVIQLLLPQPAALVLHRTLLPQTGRRMPPLWREGGQRHVARSGSPVLMQLFSGELTARQSTASGAIAVWFQVRAQILFAGLRHFVHTSTPPSAHTPDSVLYPESTADDTLVIALHAELLQERREVAHMAPWTRHELLKASKTESLWRGSAWMTPRICRRNMWLCQVVHSLTSV